MATRGADVERDVMASRSRGRQLAVQIIYQKMFSGYELERVLELFWRGIKADEPTREFSRKLVEGVLKNEQQLDLEISAYLKNWSLDRIAVVDRIILQIAFYEFIYVDPIPWKVVIDEAVMLAKLFCNDKSANFINGVLHSWATKNISGGAEAETKTVTVRANDSSQETSET